MKSPSAVEGGLPMGLWVSIPAYTGEIKVETAHSVNVEMMHCFNRKIPLMVYFHEQDSIITRCRNAMCMQFLASDPKQFTDMIFLDSDIGFPPGTLLRLAEHPVDIVGCAYPYRKDPIGFPMTFLKGENGPNVARDAATGLIPVAGLPSGCLRITRRVLEGIMARFPEHYYNEQNVPQLKAWNFFEFIQRDHRFYGEDYAFCALAREAGFEVWCDPEPVIKHIGMKKFQGSFSAWIELEQARLNPDKMALVHAFVAMNRQAEAA